MTFTNDIPNIRIGILQSTDKVVFKTTHAFTVQNTGGTTLQNGDAEKQYTLTIRRSSPAELRYQVRAGIERDVAKAEKWAGELSSRGLDACVRTVGLEFKIQNRTISNREHWIVIGDFTSYEDALAFRNVQENPGEFVVVENILNQASGEIEMDGRNLGPTVRIVPDSNDESSHITISNIMIGIQFHWQKFEDLDYRGVIEVGFNNQGKLVAINEIDLENYLVSVNSSEMTSDCPIGLLESQTVIARNTALATMGKHHYNTNFHLCSDDHCQCYHGKKREQRISRQAVENTWGQILLHGDEICDARYSKICGGIMEDYRYVWENRDIPYMVSGVDSDEKIDYPANTEETARALIDASLPVYCNTEIHKLPEKLANLYSTKNLFRWEVIYSREELEKLIAEKTGKDIGELRDIIPLERGDSGRLIYINLVGSGQTLKIGKELEIRRVLSKSHLYSSCFYVSKEFHPDGKVARFIFKGAGWGHGVGLCQVGATVMALKKIPYQNILMHYYKNTKLVNLYFLKK